MEALWKVLNAKPHPREGAAQERFGHRCGRFQQELSNAVFRRVWCFATLRDDAIDTALDAVTRGRGLSPALHSAIDCRQNRDSRQVGEVQGRPPMAARLRCHVLAQALMELQRRYLSLEGLQAHPENRPARLSAVVS
jgi:hypothetical protein